MTRLLLGELLDKEGITPNALYEAISARHNGKITRNTVYNLARQDRPLNVRLHTLDVLIEVLGEMIGRELEVGDLLEYQRK
jgi:DNA-binding Xre family transcriptional regulator